eukprot:CAMPEP_0176407472 /NCGR_PEP_ID=MMETSP0127-20121128/1430_1 /TAXON_ID=938130 /ORGANISM="Platyophrya macrostoma, Strain WH" /LENGTH=238 /DNA_ID=CAMNT_0017786681 /DNA_START=40 /DNA_END=756 /DNA_ORIENTATION=+
MALKYRTRRSHGMCTEMFRGVLMLVNITLALGSLAIIGILGYTQAESTGHLTDVCHSCKSIIIFAIALFCTLFIFSMIGFCALYRRNTCLLLTYGFYLVIFFLGAMAITIVFVMVKNGKFDNRMEQVWDSAVGSSTENLCSLELDLKCSGWQTLCSDNETYLTNNTIGCPACDAQTTIAQYNQTCYNAINSNIDDYYNPIVITGFTLAGLAFLSIVVSYRVRRYNKNDDDEGGTYTRM